MSQEPAGQARSGYIYGFVAFGIWALFPFYWDELSHVDSYEILAHRILWTLPVSLLVLLYLRDVRSALAALANLRTLAVLAFAASLISFNWATYIWAVTNDQILQASLGYFLNPLVNVLAGLLIFKEHLRPLQWVAVALACAGVLVSAISLGEIPVVGLILAVSFGIYGALRKLLTVEAVPGLFIETLLLAPFALGYLIWLWTIGQGVFASLSVSTDLLLIGTGVVTAIPLLCYVAAAQRLPISTVGMLFYLTPSGLFVLAALVYDEPITQVDMVTFGFIWAGLLLFTLERQRHARRMRETAI